MNPTACLETVVDWENLLLFRIDLLLAAAVKFFFNERNCLSHNEK
jgi:hypothetical protein